MNPGPLSLEQRQLLRQRLAHRLADVHEAISRLESAVFGVCPACGDPIGWERLEAIPQARHCAPCATRLEHGRPAPMAARL